MSYYNIGTGIHEVTDPAIGLQMQGFADPTQKTGGVESPLFSRAFIVEDRQAGKRIVIVSADIWAVTNIIKQEVARRLQEQFDSLYTIENILISGTHTHSGPGGYSDYYIYNLINDRFSNGVGGGFDYQTFECIVAGIVASIQKAHINLAPGKIYVNKGNIEDCGRNRSMPAYLKNPESERSRYPDTDNEMLLLKFMRLDRSGREMPIGVLTWYALHPTDRGQMNPLVCGDSKGYASILFEGSMGINPEMPDTFVAAFANANAGDVSGNVEYGQRPNGIDDVAHMQKHGRQQFDKARQLFDSASEELAVGLDYRYTHVDMSAIAIENSQGARTYPAAIGLSFAAGSTEDSDPGTGLREGILEGEVGVTERTLQVLSTLAGGAAYQLPTSLAYGNEIVQGHLPKPILFAIGARTDLGPQNLPLQLFKIGQLVITGVPAEFTTMAGRRLRETVLPELSSLRVRHLAIAGYANDYSQYVTTKEEYDMQHYEGASNLFGPYTLQAYQQEFRKLAIALTTGSPVGAVPLLPSSPFPIARRWRFRNLSSSDVQIKLYNTDDRGGIFSRALTLPNGTKTIPANSEVAFQEREFTGLLLPTISAATVVLSRSQERDINVGSLVNITAAGTLDVTEYTPPNPWVNEQAFRDLANGRSLWVESNQKPIPVMTASPSWLSLLLN
jgi:neutral ceramidase